MRRLRDEALVLQRRDLGESDRVVVLLCREQGRCSAVAPAGRRSRKRFGGCLDLFCRIEVELVDRGQGGLWRLEEASLLDAHPGIRTDLISVAHASYLADLTLAFLREGEEASQVFDGLASELVRLGQGPLQAMELRRYELQVLERFGVAPAFEACLLCGAEAASLWWFDHDGGGLVCGSCRPGPRSEPIKADVRSLLLGLQAGLALSSLPATGMPGARALLARIIDGHAGRPLKAREFLNKLALDRSGE